MEPLKIKPLGQRLLVKRLEAETSKGGIFLPEGSQEKPKQGVVMRVSEGFTDENGTIQPLEIKKGDQVMFGSYAGTKIQNDSSNEFLILSEDEILAVIN